MAGAYKYYRTNIMLYGERLDRLVAQGYRGNGDQFEIVCKAKSRAEANRMAESYGLGENVFRPKYTGKTANESAIDKADKYGFIINASGILGYNYVDIQSILHS